LYRVALLIETSKAFGRGLLAGVGRFARLHGQWSTFVDERGLSDPIPDWVESGDFDGIIVRASQRETLEHVIGFGIPTICLGEENPISSISVMNDDEACAELAAQHLLERGFANFGFLGHRGVNWSDVRRDHFQRALAVAGRDCNVLEASVETTCEAPWYQRRERLANWITELPKPVGILACYDSAARTILEVCRDLDLLVPEQVAVMGVDNDEVLCDLCDPPLTSVAPDTEAIGIRAAELLHRLMDPAGGTVRPLQQKVNAGTETSETSPTKKNGVEAECVERSIIVGPAGVVTRGSTDTLAIEDPLIAAVAGYIRRHASDGIDVSNLLSEFPMSRRTLERRFNKALNQTPLELIRRVRINHVKALLRETDLKLDSICEMTGFNYTAYMVGCFKEVEGMTPGQYRKQMQ
jgi:LacI family transcriptional regulator